MPNTNAHNAPEAKQARPSEESQDVNVLTARAVQLRGNRRYDDAARIFGRIAELLPSEWVAQYNCGAALLEANRLAEAARSFECAIGLKPDAGVYAVYAHTLALAGDMPAARSAYERATAYAPHDFAANWGLFEVYQLLGDNAAALRHQRIALQTRSLLTIEARVKPARTTILELCVAGTFQANIPLDFILDPNSVTVHKLYLGEHPIPPLPAYDIVFNTIAEASNVETALQAAARFIAAQDRPVLNAPESIMATARDAIANRFRDSRCVAVADTLRLDRHAVASTSMTFPLLIRPLDSHAGNDLAKVDDRVALDAYIAGLPDVTEFYVAQFIDYRNSDGFYRKYRIVFVDGVPYPVHEAISPRWMIHYYNAPMVENAWMRDEEHAFLCDMHAIFRDRAADGLREIAGALPLDYFGIDCSIAPDGRLLLFEASTAMIVHMRDPADMFPYKLEYVPRIIRALETLIDERIEPGMRQSC